MKVLLDSTPDIDSYLQSVGVSEEQLSMLGIKKESLKTIKDLTDLALTLKALRGDVKAKTYLDEMYKIENTVTAMNLNQK